MLTGNPDAAWLKSDFYRESYQRMARWVLIQMAINFVLLFVISYLIFFQPKAHYFITTTGGVTLPFNGGRVVEPPPVQSAKGH